MHTPEQAKDLWCPMVRIARRETFNPDGLGDTVLVGGCNTDALGRNRVPASCTCIADKCAMWRWVVVRDPTEPERSDCVMYDKPPRMVRNGEGYCCISGRQA
ncbi:hypothetical protein [Bradyrhizobium sp. cf659]|uniref:hypothetical protein n=1 Tax=Bradyrhizobium sp. cf659 TaxID=1761771 RepID=UPI0008EB5844|nr:hypothetical protein [Bradyrhizobium sp. cf659]SFJ85337.1 hypothetical protein SAMN04487925_112112 [Bradyrhizobium sp. cf659]